MNAETDDATAFQMGGPDHGIRMWAFFMQAIWPLLVWVIASFLILVFIRFVAFPKLAWMAFFATMGDSESIGVLSVMSYFRFQAGTSFSSVLVYGAVIVFYLVSAACVLDVILRSMTNLRLRFPLIPEFDERCNLALVDETGQIVRDGIQFWLRRMMTFGVFYGGPLASLLVGKALGPLGGVSILMLWILYWISQIAWIEFHPRQRALHDCVLNLWRVETPSL